MNAYELLRASKIAKNKEKLKQLGLDNRPTKSQNLMTNRNVKPKEANVPVRRSMRLKQSPENFIATGSAHHRHRHQQQQINVKIESPQLEFPAPIRRPKPPATYAYFPLCQIDDESVWSTAAAGRQRKVSSKELNINFERFHASWLGHQLLPFGKDPVMKAMCSTSFPKFSKMSGVQPWANAVVLFVNIATDDDEKEKQKKGGAVGTCQHGSYGNVFTLDAQGRAHIEWFAQPMHRSDSPVVVRLQSNSRRHNNKSNNNDRVLLFCRATSMPYVYFGELAYVEHFVEESPIRFRFELCQSKVLEWDKIAKEFGPAIIRRHNEM